MMIGESISIRKGAVAYIEALSQQTPGETEKKLRKTLVKIIHNSAAILTEYIQNKSPDCYSCMNL
jgi:hypothetical protein